VLNRLVRAVSLPVNVMVAPGAPSIADLEAAGVRRVSVGTAITQAAYTVAQRAAVELLTKGSYGELDGALGFGDIDPLFRR
jgi:2-methylisocitrate lyase-like PEP mutase family enzyme